MSDTLSLSFSKTVKLEVLSLPIKMNCCKKAFLFGLLFNSHRTENGGFVSSFGLREAAETAERLLGDGADCEITEKAYAGKKYFFLRYNSKAFSSFLSRIKYGQSISEAARFRCDGCVSAFVGGLIVSLSSVNDPRKGYRLELSLVNEDSIAFMAAIQNCLSENGFEFKIGNRGEKRLLYIKENTAISDILSFVGAMKASFDVANTFIERDIRNNENRATNFVAKNISKSVASNQRHIAAIKKLLDKNMLEKLPSELYETALLRLENADMSLAELALIHDPPITKSGLNHRLARICREAEEISG